jgi:putative membrane protein
MTERTTERDVTRRTHLAAERTWLAWWRTGVAVTTAAIAIGGLVPQLVESGATPYVVLGGGYAALAIAVFVAGAKRHKEVSEELERGGYAELNPAWVSALTIGAIGLALATGAVVVIVGG